MSVFPFVHISLDIKRVKNIYCLFFSVKGSIFYLLFFLSYSHLVTGCLHAAEAR